ncbi:uncharacterized protein LOC123918941 isoform X1 [Trifolium pratense]|uniref:uncharacterized protein LOC123918941 isoform X1 n=1 Tax=Trifolium pratense TaxID=57577 RepID=UPI001E695B8F|nr:uncharacterized protein LOC123918941 isoform X1 [Trifolium pratense]
MAYSRSFMFLGVILFVILSTQVLDANHVPEPSNTKPMASMHSHLMFSESDLMTIHENLMKKYDAKTILKRQKILNDVFDKKNEVSISGEEEKVFLDDKEDKLQKSVDENDVSKNHEEDKVSLSDAEDKVTKGNHEGKISKNDNEDSARERDDGRARANKEMEELITKLNVLYEELNTLNNHMSDLQERLMPL